MSKKAATQIKIMKQILDRLIPSDDNHTVLQEGRINSIEVIPTNDEEQTMTFRLPCRNKVSPAKFVVTFTDIPAVRPDESTLDAHKKRDKLVAAKDLRMFVSQDEKEPKQDRCDAIHEKEKTFYVNAKNGAKQFDCHNIYVSFYSKRGCSISVRVKFIDPKATRVIKREKVSEPVEYTDPKDDPFFELRNIMAKEKVKQRKFNALFRGKHNELLQALEKNGQGTVIQTKMAKQSIETKIERA
jgi:hypothetical protein